MTTTLNEVKNRSFKSIFQTIRSYLIDSIRQLNFYSDDPFWSSTLTYSQQIINTRLFLIFISISLSIVIIYSSLINVTNNVTLNEFSIDDFERLEYLYPNTINALCSHESIPYEKFLYLSPIFHQVCSSSFIEYKWISSLFFFNATSHNILDYRTYGFAQYRSLSLLCNISRQSVKDTHRTFNSTHFVNHDVLSRNQFNEISFVLLNNFQKNILFNEKQTGQIISMMTAYNQLWSALRTNYYVRSIPGSRLYNTYSRIYLVDNQTEDSSCECRSKGNQCIYPAGAFYNWTSFELDMPEKNYPPPRFQIPGLMAGCTPLDSIRQSTLECLYNQTCINAISLQPEISRPQALNRSLTRFLLNTTIGSIFDEALFVESWQDKSNYENYFSACAPQSLSYSYEKRFHFRTILTLSLSAFSGLVIVWKLITPIFLKIFHFIQRKKQTSIELQTIPGNSETVNIVVKTRIYQKIHNFNLFPSDDKNDIEEERIGIITTRLYIFLICISLIILGFYTNLSKKDQINIIKNPSMEKFEELNLKYSTKLNCPCSRFSMSYNRIISLSTRYHSICRSEFLKDYWLSYFNQKNIQFMSTDIRTSGLAFFNLIKILCKTSEETIENAIIIFRTNRLITMNTLSYEQFSIEIQTRLKFFQQQTISSFLHLIQLIRSAIQINQLVEEMYTNVGHVSKYNNDTSTWLIRYKPRSFYTDNCSCLLSNECTRLVGFYYKLENRTSIEPNIPIPGLVLGCYAIDSVLLSTLECFYEKKCIKILIDNYDFDAIGLVQPLDNRTKRIQPLSRKQTRFYPKITINEIFSQLFVEEWFNSTNYTSYYTRCKPLQCTYTVRKNFDIAYMLAIMLGFYGGLSVILDIILYPMVKFVIKRSTKRNPTNMITTDASMESSTGRNTHSIYQKILTMNFFKNNSSSNEKEFEYEEIFATRIYILFLLLSVIIILLYSGPFNDEKQPIKIDNPSIDLINDLYNQNYSSLTCPCSKVAINYSKFLSIKFKFHPICSKEFLSLDYRKNLLENNESSELITHYRILSSLCHLSKEFLNNAKHVFDNQEYTTIELSTKSLFNIEIKSFLLNFLHQTKSNYKRTSSFIMNSFHVNQLVNLFLNNWNISFTDQNQNYIINTFPNYFSSSNCTCAISSHCNKQLTNDIYIGCFPYNGFYLSKYENISLGKLNDQLFVQKWINQTNYTNYFQTCQPLQCQYISSNKNYILSMFIILLELYGGLTFCLYFIIKQFLLAYLWWIKTKK
ncbi:unnamed protein product [Adineta steineri]|uniref:Uncharacterized protein n=1 Tax=Adineta steineri TaxID=433720 RepID=A0A813WTE6_9BILA|nr:unnamed protein product [Adineta steineri]